MSDWRLAPVGRPPPFRIPLNWDESCRISDGTDDWAWALAEKAMAATAAASENFILSSWTSKTGDRERDERGKEENKWVTAGSPAGRRPQQRERGW